MQWGYGQDYQGFPIPFDYIWGVYLGPQGEWSNLIGFDNNGVNFKTARGATYWLVIGYKNVT